MALFEIEEMLLEGANREDSAALWWIVDFVGRGTLEGRGMPELRTGL